MRKRTGVNSLAFFTSANDRQIKKERFCRTSPVWICASASYRQVRSHHFREVTEMVDISLAAVANSATVPSILQRLAKWQYLYFDRGNKGISGMQRLVKVFYRKEGLS